MNEIALKKKFRSIGAKVVLDEVSRPVWRRDPVVPFELDVVGDTFEIRLEPESKPEIVVAQARPRERHLLLTIATEAESDRPKAGRDVQRFLCGYDERAWFVAAVPAKPGAATVAQAMEALKPEVVRQAQARARLKGRRRNKRRNAAFVRQGEWFFVPAPEFQIDDWFVLRREPMQRGRGKPHVAEFLCRSSGTRVYVCQHFPNGLTEQAYRKYIHRKPESKKWRWHVMVRNPDVYVKGRIVHPDHRTVRLAFWHRVAPNTETEAPSMRHMAFLD